MTARPPKRARQAATFAREAEHPELLAWTYELLAWWALVDRRYHEVIDTDRTGGRARTSAGVQLAVQQAKGCPALVMLRGRTSPYAWRVRSCRLYRAPSIPSTTSS